ncbi:uncharacterized protein LOC112595475 isoform X2 [Melanaphis sacchari]|uniref:uncharacterized protein LOC112595475 isoform X2 n=1 Tax=Melanaphis sacchari TaxID=742174 RepID=UPI000DC13766|nr:uncharacterized protein LOC112595475 isoform X2 [Melanaphis sacchari]
MLLFLNNARRYHHSTTTVVTLSVAILLTIGQVHNLKCRTADHSRRHGEFVDIAEQCSNMTSGDRSVAVDGDYSTYVSSGDNDGRWNGDKRRNNNREFSVNRQDFINNRGGSNGGYDRDLSSCGEVRPQQYSGNTGSRTKNHRQGSYPSVDYDMGQSNSNYRQSQSTRRYRRDDSNDKNKRQKVTMTGNNSRLLGNNRFRNLTKIGGNQPGKGTFLDKIDACTIHCVFNQLEMLNSNSHPDKRSIVNIMTNQIKDVELKEFIQDSIDECFDALELESHNNKCEFSKNFAMCMENKAQRNCDDWDENLSANKINSAGLQDGNNQQDKRKGY